jgi:uncharacterized protein with FMN-binding domain
MPKRGAFAIGLTVVALVLLLNFQTPGAVGTLGGVRAGARPSARPSAVTTTAGTRTLTGPTVGTRWGPVQVQVTVTSGKITDITALQLPSGGRSGQISSFASPVLRGQALQAQGSSIDGVSGATYTSTAYARSLQAALDGAGT